MSSLPLEMITSILIRLPVKSILRFRAVSKLWRSLIDGPHFINLHLSHSITTRSNYSFITESRDGLYSLDSDSLENLEKMVTPFDTNSLVNLENISPRCDSLSYIYNTCNGLLLMAANGLVIFNPSTRKHLVLPDPPPENNCADLDFVQGSVCLGYDAINDDYKVFVIRKLVDKDKNFVTCEARIYSMKSNLWRFVEDFTKGMIFGCFFGAYVYGALHAPNYEDWRNIVALDVEKEDFNLIPIPNFEDQKVSYFETHVFDGCLTVLCRYPDDRTDIWLMKEYGVKESWSMLLSTKLENSSPTVIPTVYSKSCSEVLLGSDYCEPLVWYDLRKKTVRDLIVSGLSTRFSCVCVESLVPVGGSEKIDGKKQHGEKK